MKINIRKLSAAALLLFAITYKVNAQVSPAKPNAADEEALKKANNPLADIKSFNVQNYIISSIYGAPDAYLNQFLLRYSQPVGKLLLRATMPFVVSSAANQSPLTGLGDFNMFAIYSLPGSNGNQFGIGPTLTVPTGTNNLGQGKWQAGISALAFFAKSHVIQTGSLLQFQGSFAGDENREKVSLLTAQMFFIWQAGGGTYLRSTGVWSFDLHHGYYNVPIGLGIGKVIKAGGTVFNIFAEPQFSVLADGAGQAKFQTFIGFNTQF